MRVLSVVGARPQFVKLAPVARAMAHADVKHTIVHTGQHYDVNLSDVFFEGLEIPTPDVNLEIGSASHGAQTGAMLASLETTIEEADPDWVLVYGDTNSTLAASVAAVKLHRPLAHLEAGLRSFNRRMPEEHNRVLTDHAADLLLAPTETAMSHLQREGLAGRSRLIGDVMVDVCLAVRDGVLARGADAGLGVDGEYYVATIHRAENTDEGVRLASIVAALAAADREVVLLAHPRLKARADAHGIRLDQGAISVREPLGYSDLVAAVLGSTGVITDSGGLQKEAYVLERPCTTVRTETEWVETLENGWNVLLPDPDRLLEALQRPAPSAPVGTPFGAGDAAGDVARTLVGHPLSS